jgi:hypothetical protein
MQQAGDSRPPPIDCAIVTSVEETRRRSGAHAKGVLMIFFAAAVVSIVGLCASSSLQATDFPDFYCAARIVLDGRGQQLYDPAVQHLYQARYAGRIGTLYIHPPFETLLYLLVVWLPLRPAYLLWSVANLVFLGLSLIGIARTLGSLDWRILFVASLTFVPVLFCLLQGQDSIVLLLLIVMTFTLLRRGSALGAGCWLALGLFKFQIVLPLALVLLITAKGKRTAFAKGFFLAATALLGLSALVAGYSVFLDYPKFLLHLPAQPFAGIAPEAMANFRGLAHMLLLRDQPRRVAEAVCSIAAFASVIRIRGVKSNEVPGPAEELSRFDAGFAACALFSLLVSYHLNPHDLTILLLPIGVLLCPTLWPKQQPSTKRDYTAFDYAILALLAVLFLPPVHLWAIRAHLYAVVAVPVLALFLLVLDKPARIDPAI